MMQFEEALQWLLDAGLLIRVNRCNVPRQPLKFYAATSFGLRTFGHALRNRTSRYSVGQQGFRRVQGGFCREFCIAAIDRQNEPFRLLLQ